MPQSPTSAAKLLTDLSLRGKEASQIEAEDVNELYEKYSSYVDAPTFPEGGFKFKRLHHTNTFHDVFGFIVETRETPVLRYVIQNYLTYGEGPVHLILGPSTRKILRRSFFRNAIERGDLFVSMLDRDYLPATNYNALLMSEEFWNELIPGRKAVCFQTDSCICPQSKFSLNDFIDFDYIGSDWKEKRPHGMKIAGGCGGFSLRDVALSKAAVERFHTNLWRAGEDDFFGFHIELLQGKVASKESRGKFCSQSWFDYPSFAAHSVGHMRPKTRLEFFKYCPEAMVLNSGY
ncbi:DUF5672 family protein [Actibacterium pelagium]|uniref:DUF5672 domain-containing protein n=1 Tax=Actibacterium pelagium TaxID=2029103 RepID=A0A917AAK2_9RHOB|nr:DUF5672 family protein [Actibacterium pelagium]GGE39166.1 hypothetical protein GCM10011517_03640 [Actibacterium pelagium]